MLSVTRTYETIYLLREYWLQCVYAGAYFTRQLQSLPVIHIMKIATVIKFMRKSWVPMTKVIYLGRHHYVFTPVYVYVYPPLYILLWKLHTPVHVIVCAPLYMSLYVHPCTWHCVYTTYISFSVHPYTWYCVYAPVHAIVYTQHTCHCMSTPVHIIMKAAYTCTCHCESCLLLYSLLW